MRPRSVSRTLLATLIIWVVGVVLIRLSEDYILTDGAGFIVGYVAAALGGPPTVLFGSMVTGFPVRRMMEPTLVIAAFALVADGLVMGFIPEVYTSPDRIHYLAPLFLWTFGWACVSAFFMAGAKFSGGSATSG